MAELLLASIAVLLALILVVLFYHLPEEKRLALTWGAKTVGLWFGFGLSVLSFCIGILLLWVAAPLSKTTDLNSGSVGVVLMLVALVGGWWLAEAFYSRTLASVVWMAEFLTAGGLLATGLYTGQLRGWHIAVCISMAAALAYPAYRIHLRYSVAVQIARHMKSNPALYKEPKEWPPGPPTCYTCRNYNYARSCQMIGPNVAIRKFTYPAKATDSAKRVEYRILLRDFETGRCSAASSDANRIEYWPYCGKWERGSPHYGTEKFVAENDPSNVGLVWINAAELGLKTGAANSFAG